MIKDFGPSNCKVREDVAVNPSLLKYYSPDMALSNVFCLRIDADEYTRESFYAYYDLFETYSPALTIFFNAFSFKDASLEIKRCGDMEIDIQSHGYYHYTYGDYASNRHNIAKAKSFFSSLGVETRGFASPMGRWNYDLMKALEDEGYEYSSDFYYDYMGYPHFPKVGGKSSSVMQIPVFPVAPELFFESKLLGLKVVEDYYKQAIDVMIGAKLPAIIYAHTNPGMPMVPELLASISNYAINSKKLKPITMTGIYEICKSKFNNKLNNPEYTKNVLLPAEFLGERAHTGVKHNIKKRIKSAIDFEKITPREELKCGNVKKMLKLFARKYL